ncbi:MAG: 50S ribosomal protein L9, partial [Chloroflexota bacterium]
ISSQITGIELSFERRSGETGKLYGSVTSGDISEALKEKTNIEIDKRKIALPEPIRTLGEQEVTVKLMIDLSTSIKVAVLPIGGILEQERREAIEASADTGAPSEEASETEEASTEEAAVEEAPAEEEASEEPVAEEAVAEESATEAEESEEA